MPSIKSILVRIKIDYYIMEILVSVRLSFILTQLMMSLATDGKGWHIFSLEFTHSD